MQVVPQAPHPSAQQFAPIGTPTSQSNVSLVYLVDDYFCQCKMPHYFYKKIYRLFPSLPTQVHNNLPQMKLLLLKKILVMFVDYTFSTYNWFSIIECLMIILNNMQVVPTAPQPSTQQTALNELRSSQSNVRLYYLVYVLILIQLVGWYMNTI